MTIGGVLQTKGANGHEMAQIVQILCAPLAWGESLVNILPVGETAIPVASAKHLFRTPSLGGQARGSSTYLPASFLCRLNDEHARGFAKTCGVFLFRLHRNLSRRTVIGTGTETKKGKVKCELQRFALRWRLWVVLRHAATRWANRPLSVAQWVQAQRPWLTAIWPPAPLLVRQATFCSASKTPANADTRPLTVSRARLGSHRIHTSRTAREGLLARGFLRGTLPKTKDVPCSTRS